MKRLFFIIVGVFCTTICMAQMTDEEKYDLAVSYYDTKEYEQAYPLFLELAEKGDAKSQCVMGYYYHFGIGHIDIDYMRAYEWYIKSSKKNYKYALNNLGSMFEHGEYVTQNYEKAYNYYMAAVEQGNALSATNIGRLFHERLIYPETDCYDKVAERWFKQAAIMDSVWGNYWLSNFYNEIISEIFDIDIIGIPDKTLSYLCDKNSLTREEGLKIKDSLEALSDSLFHRAVINGCSSAQSSLGSKYFSSEKYIDAKHWFTMAKNNGAEYVSIDVDTYPIDLALVLIEFLQKNPDIHYAIRPMNGSAAPKDENWVITTEKGYFEFLMREGDDWHMGLVRLSLDGKLLVKHPAIHNTGWYDEEKNILHFDDHEGSTSSGVSKE